MSLFQSAILSACLLQIFIINQGVVGQKRENDPCQLENKLGICKLPEKCPNSSYKKYTKCGRRSPLVCCPTCPVSSGLRPITDKAELKCNEYFMFFSHPINHCSVHVLPNGTAETYIVAPAGGEDAKPKDKIHMAILGYDVNGGNLWGCGGSLISEEYVLTAAHCTYNMEYGEVKRARLGDLNIDRDDDDAEPQNFDIIEVIIHPDYKAPSKYNDIALLKLDRKAKLTPFVHPACVPSKPRHFSNEYGPPYEAAGWGKMGPDGPYSPHLQIVKLEEFTNEECNMHYQNAGIFPSRRLKNGIEEATQICAGHHTKRVDTCQGDSGGSLQLKKDLEGLFDIIGVTSFGLPCATSEAPGVYTRVAPYVPWIESIVWP